MARQGVGEPKDPKRASALTKQGCDYKDTSSCISHADDLIRGVDIEANPEAGRRMLEKFCNEGVAGGCYNLAQLMHEKILPVQHPDDVARLFERGCVLGNAVSCNDLGALIMSKGSAAQSLELYKRACKMGAQIGCDNLAGVRQRAQELLTELEAACAGGDGEACYKAGGLVSDGLHGSVEPVRSRTYQARGCALKHPPACFYLARMRLEGYGGPQEPDAALQDLQRLCDETVMEACLVSGQVLANKDKYPEAMGYYERACTGKVMRGCGALGVMLVTGTGAPPDPERGLTLLTQACIRDNLRA